MITPHKSVPLSTLSHGQLHHRITTLMSRERRVTLRILDHLAELDRRRLYRDRGHSSLFSYVVNELGYSTSSGVRRIAAARAITKHPPLRALLEQRQITLGALSAVAGVMNGDNIEDLTQQLRGKSIRDAQAIVAQVRGDDVTQRDRIRPVIAKPTANRSPGLPLATLSASAGRAPKDHIQNECKNGNTDAKENPEAERPVTMPKEPRPTCEVLKRYRVEFTIDETTTAQLQKAMALASHRVRGAMTTERLLQIVLAEFIERHDPAARARRREERMAKSAATDGADANRTATTRTTDSRSVDAVSLTRSTGATRPEPTRHIPARIRDDVFIRDGGQCTFVAPDGHRCLEQARLEVDHVVPFALGGSHSPGNLRLMCQTHNRLMAERMFGSDKSHPK